LFWVENALTSEDLTVFRKAANEAFYDCWRALMVKNVMSTAKGMASPPVQYSEIVERGGARYDCRHRCTKGPMSSLLRDGGAGAMLVPILKAVLGDEATVVSVGQLIALPEVSWLEMEGEAQGEFGDQRWHTDGRNGPLDTDALTLFIPLVDLTENNGPTQYVLRSHLQGKVGLNGGNACENSHLEEAATTLLLPAGSAVAFDFRLWHRGTANFSESDRSILCCVVGRPLVKTDSEGHLVMGLPELSTGSDVSLFGGNRVPPAPPFFVGSKEEVVAGRHDEETSRSSKKPKLQL
jgi:hypothetical protein